MGFYHDIYNVDDSRIQKFRAFNMLDGNTIEFKNIKQLREAKNVFTDNWDLEMLIETSCTLTNPPQSANIWWPISIEDI